MKQFNIGDVVKLTKEAHRELDTTGKGRTAVVTAISGTLVYFDDNLLKGYCHNNSIGKGWLKLVKPKPEEAKPLRPKPTPVTIWFITPEDTIDFRIAHGSGAVEAIHNKYKYSSTDINEVATILRSSDYWLD